MFMHSGFTLIVLSEHHSSIDLSWAIISTQVYKKLQEVHHFQQDSYKLHQVPELSEYLISHRPVPEDDLHSLSQTLEPRIKRSLSQTNARVSSTGSQKGSFFKSISRSSASASNLNKVWLIFSFIVRHITLHHHHNYYYMSCKHHRDYHKFYLALVLLRS